MLFMPAILIFAVLLKFSNSIFVKNPGLFLFLICLLLYNVLTTSVDLNTSATLDLAADSDRLKYSTKP